MAYVGIIYQTETSMKGSSNMYLEIEKVYGREILDSFYKELEDVSTVDKPAKMEGRSMVMFLSATK